MSVFPSLPGLDIAVKRSEIYATTVQTAASGKELRGAWWSLPRYNYELTFNFLRRLGFSAQTAVDEMLTLIEFFESVEGRWGSFQFTDPVESAVTAVQFGTGNSVLTTFQLVDRLGATVAQNGVPSIYRQDWQGNQLMYPTSRTNYLLQSQAMTTSPWISSNASCAGGVSDPAGGTNAFTVTATAASGYWYQQVTVPAGTYTNSLWIRRRTGTGAIQVWAPSGSGVPVAVTSSWQRFSESGSASGTTDFFGVQFATSGDQVDIAFGQVEPGSAPTAYIGPTTTSSVTVTDYTTTTAGAVTFAAAPLTGAVLTWTGNFYRNCRFDQDSLDLQGLVNLCWKGGSVKLCTVK